MIKKWDAMKSNITEPGLGHNLWGVPVFTHLITKYLQIRIVEIE